VTSDVLSLLQTRWRAQGVKLRPGASEAEIERFEGEKRVVLPRDFRSFLLAMNGMEEDEVDSDTQIRFWSLAEIRSVVEELGGEVDCAEYDEQLFLFADYSLWAHGYAIRLAADPRETNVVAIVGGDAPVHAATSFSHFLEKYLEDPQQLF